jgi:hypothetical protein
MFKWLFSYWYNPTDNPSLLAKINLWSYINIKIFKIKMQNQLLYFILGLNGLSLKKYKIFYKNFSFEIFFYKIIYFLILFFFFFLFI